jgi:ABC-type lipoprotein export system ATPase subunit
VSVDGIEGRAGRATGRATYDGGVTTNDPRVELIDLAEEERLARRPKARFGERALIVCDNLVKIYKVADLEVVALQGLDLLIDEGEFVAIVGASGSGKSTLLSILAGLDVPSAGRGVVAGHELAEMGTREHTDYLRNVIGFVWQQTSRNLFPYLTARENVELPMVLEGMGPLARERRVRELLEQVGMADRADHRPDRMSGGEQQRIAIAVALANGPAVLLADEPTGQLDTATGHEIFELFRKVNTELGVTILVATHDPLVSEQVARTVAIRDGRVASEVLRERAISETGDHHVISTEYAVLDRAGRLQLPRAHVEALALENRVRLELEPDHIGVWPDAPTKGEPRARPAVPAAESTVLAAPPAHLADITRYRRPPAAAPRGEAGDGAGGSTADGAPTPPEDPHARYRRPQP